MVCEGIERAVYSRRRDVGADEAGGPLTAEEQGAPQKGKKKAKGSKVDGGAGLTVSKESAVLAIITADPHRSGAEAKWLAEECIGNSGSLPVDAFLTQLRSSLVQRSLPLLEEAPQEAAAVPAAAEQSAAARSACSTTDSHTYSSTDSQVT